MNNHLKLWAVLGLLAVAGAGTARAQEESWDRAKLDRFFDGGSRSPAALIVSPATGHKRRPAPERWKGMEKGASEGALFGFMGVISPAAGLLSEGFGRQMSSHYDGPRGDNGNAGLYNTAGVALGVLLYIPALVAGAVGGVVGGLIGGAAPGAASKWDAEKFLFDKRK